MIHFDVKINCISLDLNKQLGHIFGMPCRYNSGEKKNGLQRDITLVFLHHLCHHL